MYVNPPSDLEAAPNPDSFTDDLSQNIRLRSIHIHHHFNLPGPTSDWVPSLISTIKSPHMETVVLKTSFFNLGDLDALDWASLEYTLAQPQFADLQKVEVCLPWSPLDWSPLDWTIKDAIRRKLPNCNERGLIKLSRPLRPPTPFSDYLHPVIVNPSPPRSHVRRRRSLWSLLQKLRKWLRKRNIF